MKPTKISVVICAYTEERYEQTLAAVESVRQQSLQSHEILVVVDHNPSLYARLNCALSAAMVSENRNQRGLSGSRNSGVALAQGDIVAFLDDDAVADPDWLKFLADSYETSTAVMGVGGLILPAWQQQRPPWFPEEFDWVIGCTYLGAPRTATPVRNMLGANMSFRREVFDHQGGFKSGIGRVAGKLPLGCEETEFCIRLAQSRPNVILLFDNRAVVRHIVSGERCRSSYFRSRCFAEGQSKALVAENVGSGDGLSTERRYVTRTLPKGAARGLIELVHGDLWGVARSGAIVVGLIATAAGYITGRLRQNVIRRRS